MSKYIHCGKWNKKYKYIALSAIFAFFTNYIFGYTFNDYLDEIKIGKATDNNKNNEHIIINYIFRYLGIIIFSFILYKYEVYIKNNIFKINSEEIIFKSSSIKLIYNNSKENSKNKIIISPLFIILIMIIMVLQEISEDIFYKSGLRALDFWMFELPLLSYFNLKYFKVKIHRHHKLVIYLNLIFCGILKIIYLIFAANVGEDNDKKEINIVKIYREYWGVIPLGIITYLIIIISRAFALSEIKVLIEYKYISPIKLLIIYGIIGTIITTIIGIISTFIECNNSTLSLYLKICQIKDNNIMYFEHFKIWLEDEINISGIFLLLIGIIMNFFYRLFYILIIKNLTAIHIIFSNLFSAYLLAIIGYINNYINNHFHIHINFFIIVFIFIINIIIFIGLLIYLEMIELDFCNLNYNLKKTIIERSIKDYELEIDNEEDEIKD